MLVHVCLIFLIDAKMRHQTTKRTDIIHLVFDELFILEILFHFLFQTPNYHLRLHNKYLSY
jgi:hypothetical protein